MPCATARSRLRPDLSHRAPPQPGMRSPLRPHRRRCHPDAGYRCLLWWPADGRWPQHNLRGRAGMASLTERICQSGTCHRRSSPMPSTRRPESAFQTKGFQPDSLICKALTTGGETNRDTSPPRLAISRTRLDEMKVCSSEGVMKMVSN